VWRVKRERESGREGERERGREGERESGREGERVNLLVGVRTWGLGVGASVLQFGVDRV